MEKVSFSVETLESEIAAWIAANEGKTLIYYKTDVIKVGKFDNSKAIYFIN